VLELTHTKVTDAGMRSVARLPRLHHLNLTYTKVGDAGLKHLGNLDGLVEIDLYDTRVTDQGLRELYPLRRLRDGSVDRSSGGSSGGMTARRKALPSAGVVCVG